MKSEIIEFLKFLKFFLLNFCLPIFILLLVCNLSGCTTKRRLKATTETKTEQTILNQKDSILTNIKNEIIETIDTSKQLTHNAEVMKVTIKEFDKQTNALSKETEYTKTNLYFSEDDKYFIEHGTFRDSTEERNFRNVVVDSSTESETKVDEKFSRKNKVAKCIGLSLLLLIFAFVTGSIIYKKIKSKF